jgi:predicted acyltransferase
MFKHEIGNHFLFVVSVRMVPLCVCRHYRATKRQMVLSQMRHYDEEEREKMKHCEPLGYATFKTYFSFFLLCIVVCRRKGTKKSTKKLKKRVRPWNFFRRVTLLN